MIKEALDPYCEDELLDLDMIDSGFQEEIAFLALSILYDQAQFEPEKTLEKTIEKRIDKNGLQIKEWLNTAGLGKSMSFNNARENLIDNNAHKKVRSNYSLASFEWKKEKTDEDAYSREYSKAVVGFGDDSKKLFPPFKKMRSKTEMSMADNLVFKRNVSFESSSEIKKETSKSIIRNRSMLKIKEMSSQLEDASSMRNSKTLNNKWSSLDKNENKSLTPIIVHSPNIEVDKVKEREKKALIDWMLQNLFSSSRTNFDFLHTKSKAKDSTFFVELINKIERKTILRTPGKNPTSTKIKVSFQKMFDHLKSFEKFNPRYIDATSYLMEGSYDVFWGLLQDIFYHSKNQISPHDRRYLNIAKNEISQVKEEKDIPLKASKSRKQRNKSEIRFKETSKEMPRKLSMTKFESLKEGSYGMNSKSIDRYSSMVKRSVSKRSLEAERSKPNPPTTKVTKNTYSTNYKYRSSKIASVCESRYENFSQVGRRSHVEYYPEEISQENSDQKKASFVSKFELADVFKIEAIVKKWLEDFFSYRQQAGRSLFEDPIRNGVLLASIILSVYNTEIKGVIRLPKSIGECKRNNDRCLAVMKEHSDDFPHKLLNSTDSFLKGDPMVIWPILYCLKLKKEKTKKEITMSKVEMTHAGLPYNTQEIIQLCEATFEWLKEIEVFQDDVPSDFEEVIDKMSGGVFLVRLIEIVLGRDISGIHLQPKARPHMLHNIRKGLDELKKEKRMSRKFIWKVDEIADKDFESCLGLLEDLRRFSDGLPPRNDQYYFEDGPYISPPKKVLLDSIVASKNFYIPKSDPGDNIDRFAHFRAKSLVPIPQTEQRPKRNDREPSSNLNSVSCSEINHLVTNFNIRLDDKGPSSKGMEFDSNSSIGAMYKSESISSRHIDGPLSFDQYKRIIRLLVYLDMPKVIERETWTSPVWTQFSDGYISC